MPYLTAEQLELLIMAYNPMKNEIYKAALEGAEGTFTPQEILLRRKEELESRNIDSQQTEIELGTLNTILRKYHNLEKRIEKRNQAKQQKSSNLQKIEGAVELDTIPLPPEFPENINNKAAFFQDLLRRSSRDMLLAKCANTGASRGLRFAYASVNNLNWGDIDAAVVI